MPGQLIGSSAPFLAVLTVLARIARFALPALITGETGTGKELAARAIHYQSARRAGPFIPVNCGALPDSLVENELFGHSRGAFTDARDSVPGMLALAHAGTLFLDEIDALSPKGQVVLLRFLQDQRFRALGASHDQHADVRIVAASNHDLGALVQAGLFRGDLLFRVKVMTVDLPPLRVRTGDAELLARHFIAQCAERFGVGQKRLDTASLRWLDRYPWPGNVRELENLIQRECLMGDGEVLSLDGTVSGSPLTAAITYRAAKEAALADFDRSYLAEALTRAGGSVTAAARVAGKERRAFGRLLKKYSISPQQFRR